MQTDLRELAHRNLFVGPRHPAKDLNFYSGCGTGFEQTNHLRVGDLRIVDEKLALRPFDERGQLLPGILGADDKRSASGFVRLALGIGVKELYRFPDEFGIGGYDAKAATALDIHK